LLAMMLSLACIVFPWLLPFDVMLLIHKTSAKRVI
jgi:hypothetical protein